MPRHAFKTANDARPLSPPKPAPGSKLCFHGSLGALQDLVLLMGVYGEWHEKPSGVWRFVCEDRAGLNWSSTRGTLWFDGPPEPRDRLQGTIEAALRTMTSRLSRRGRS